MIQAPVFHVNGDDPESVLFVAQMAVDYRMTFKKDVVIDIVSYRRRGHNEGDEPAITQPQMYSVIRKHPTTLTLHSQKVIAEGTISEEEYLARVEQYRDDLEAEKAVAWDYLKEPNTSMFVDWAPFLDPDNVESVETGVAPERFRTVAAQLQELPEGFVLHRQVTKILEDRKKMAAGAMAINWGFAEVMAYATLLSEGYRVRLTGQDVGRGTFSHRHAVVHDQKEDRSFCALQHLSEDQPDFSLFDSFLSEEAVLAFEYGYSQTSPQTLDIWEAQFGDFANGAQVVIDQFIASGEHKWARMCGLTMLLPHGYEGQGPEHSSARLERYLQLCAEHNMQVCTPTTPAQIFHLLRRQIVHTLRRPLIIMSPKSLLRHKVAVSTLEDLTSGQFRVVVDDDQVQPEDVTRIVICSGKVYYDLLEKLNQEEGEPQNVAIVRIEQLYPFPEDELKMVISRYPNVAVAVWCQEEPMNQGAWYSSQHHMRRVVNEGYPGLYLQYAGREASAAAAAGYASLHAQQQESLVTTALFGNGT